jgi:S-adenosylmethionine:tRNA ribosyltransferase-isomerase
MSEWIRDYDFELPEELIAQAPLEDRSSSRLLHLDPISGDVQHRRFRDITNLLRPGDLLVMNNTRVTALRLFGEKSTGAQVEALLLREVNAGEYEAMVKPAKRLQIGSVVNFEGDLVATVTEENGGLRTLKFQGEDVSARLADVGHVPLPPYITTRLENPDRYQTVYAQKGGSAAAPTAGLHFTPELLATLRSNGIEFACVTLDVGLDTFRPISVDSIPEHKMHGEACEVAGDVVRAIENCAGRVIAIGTTTVRTLESFAIGPRQLRTGQQRTQIFISPGYKFQIIDGMFTNFHMPRTTMLMMISALAGRENVMRAYGAAISERYRFLSFGDSMLILPT